MTVTVSSTGATTSAPAAEPPAPEPGQRRPDTDASRRRELASFLRSRRERITPEHVGLPAAGRRRTPGLRREEVAQLAGVGVTWYTWLEQARDIRVSETVLDAVARTLELDPHERVHLFTLAGVADHNPAEYCTVIGPVIPKLLTQLEPFPAAVVNARFDVLAYNRVYRLLTDDLDSLPADDRNLMWLVFTHPAWRDTHDDWDGIATWMVAQYRSLMADHVGEPGWQCLVDRLLKTSAEFRSMWDRHDVGPIANKLKFFNNRFVGRLELEGQHLWLSERTGTRMVTYAPRDERSAQRLQQLLDRAIDIGDASRARAAALDCPPTGTPADVTRGAA